MPNLIAYFVIYTWPLIVIFFFKRYGAEKAIIYSLIGSYMFLPARFTIDLPIVPPLNKYTITTFTIALYLIVNRNKLGVNSLPSSMKFILLIFILSPIMTALTNSERYLHLPGLTVYDGVVNSVMGFIVFMPFLLGVFYLKTYKSQIFIFKVFSAAAIVYAFLALYEIRMSPQLHNIFYGYFPHSWIQQYRSGGFRAVVFMGHGLLVALFLAIGLATLASLYKIREKISDRINTKIFLVFLVIALIGMKSLAALLFGVFMFVMIGFGYNRLMHIVAVGIAVIFLTYPITSSLNLFPHDGIINFAEKIDPERAESLAFRFHHENVLLDKANQKPWFGWGSWGRSRIFDVETGEDISVTDGKWVIDLGSGGWIGFLSESLFIVIPLWLALKVSRRKTIPRNELTLLAAHSLIVSIILLDQMPNTSMNPFYWLIIGALLGRVYDIKKHLKLNEQKPKNYSLKIQ